MRKKISEIIRVNQAGEDGAIRIYKGQLAALNNKSDQRKQIEHMYAQEIEHLDYFNKKMLKHRVRPTVMSPIWRIGAYALGYFSGKLGVKAAMACTEAVEEVIEKHYQQQINYLEQCNDEEMIALKDKIQDFQNDEVQHKNIGATYSDDSMRHVVLKAVIRKLTAVAVIISKKI